MNASIQKLAVWTGVLFLTVSLTGCYESPTVTLFEPGVYKGAADPLLTSSDNESLNERFTGQMDR
ncbi:MAG: hypothetical protein OXF60_07600 [Gammaproteobacteria bacterium]|nr:hypothetical protein [Gammaproteobacteria bacterium]MCY4218168.1 hypothetical protein [Gammaproteobacteria bacterium]